MPTFDDLQRLAEKPKSTPVVYRDATGRPFALGGGEAKPPGMIHSQGERGFSLSALIKARMTGASLQGTLEGDIDAKLQALGYYPSLPGGVMIPLGADYLWGDSSAADAVREVVKHAFAQPMGSAEDIER